MITANAIITTAIGNSQSRMYPTKKLAAFDIDSAMDTDSDAFSIDFDGDPELAYLLARDNEVKVNLFTKGSLFGAAGQIIQLQTGIADTVSWASNDGMLSIAGRDLSSVAVDSQAPPGETKQVRPAVFIRKEAATLGINKMRLADLPTVKKLYRDGSESYWESWYRLVRQTAGFWIWHEPDGTLVIDKLHYATSPTYYFGSPAKGTSNNKWVPVEQCRITKDTTQRVGEVWVFVDTGKKVYKGEAKDPSIQRWTKRPLKIISSNQAKSQKEATTEAWEEIFEGKVGALEIEVTIPYSGSIVRQNEMAHINIPAAGLNGIFFVVGSKMVGGLEGFGQTVRLREKSFALSRRKPDDPELVVDNSQNALSSDIGAGLEGVGAGVVGPEGIRWADCFAKSAKAWHGGWPMDLFLSTLMAICEHESHFTNVINDGPEYRPAPNKYTGSSSPNDRGTTIPSGTFSADLEKWYNDFANAPGNPRIQATGQDSNARANGKAVGPMQLLTNSYKIKADGYGGKSGEYDGGRWDPCANIYAAGEVLLGKASGLPTDNPDNLFIGVGNYYGSSSKSANAAYGNLIKKRVDEYFLPKVQTAVEASAKVPTTGGTLKKVQVQNASGKEPSTVMVELSDVAPERISTLVRWLLNQIGKKYVWGAEGPDTFDCSGLLTYCYAKIGINLIHQASQQYGQGTAVKKSQLSTGDAVFFNNLDHVGVYLNDNQFIHAPHTGDVVKISTMTGWYSDTYVGARRYVNWKGAPN